ncbi:MAG: SpoIIE family protein phosphatase [Bryobacteraceae bacterium]
MRDSGGKSATVSLDRDRISLGRSSHNELCYPEDAGLSRQHLALVRTPEGWAIEDLGSKNGTLLNGARVEGVQPFRPGDRVSAGHLTLEFTDATGVPSNTVVFIEKPESTSVMSTTVVASLEGVLGPEEVGDFSKTYVMPQNPQMRALIRAGRELASHRPLAELFEVIMDLSLEAVGAGRGVLMTLEGEALQVRAVRGDKFEISSTVRDRVLREKASLLVRDAQLDLAFRAQQSIVEQKVRSMLAVPLQTNDRVIGLIYLDSPHLIREFSREDLNLLTVMANVAAIRIEHARLAEVEAAERVMAKELDQAAQIQRRLLPSEVPVLPGLDLAGYNVPCNTVGGDYYDFVPYEDGRVAIVVGDVAGKGMPASLLMSSLQARVQVLFEEPTGVAGHVTRLNKAVSTRCPENRFITFFACVIDPKTGELTYCNAGHNPPLLVRKNGDVERLTVGGVFLGLFPVAKYQEGTAKLESGDIVILFSDGASEATPGDRDEEYSEVRLATVAARHSEKSALQILEAINQDLAEFTAGAPFADDVTLVIARLT